MGFQYVDYMDVEPRHSSRLIGVACDLCRRQLAFDSGQRWITEPYVDVTVRVQNVGQPGFELHLVLCRGCANPRLELVRVAGELLGDVAGPAVRAWAVATAACSAFVRPAGVVAALTPCAACSMPWLDHSEAAREAGRKPPSRGGA